MHYLLFTSPFASAPRIALILGAEAKGPARYLHRFRLIDDVGARSTASKNSGSQLVSLCVFIL